MDISSLYWHKQTTIKKGKIRKSGGEDANYQKSILEDYYENKFTKTFQNKSSLLDPAQPDPALPRSRQSSKPPPPNLGDSIGPAATEFGRVIS